MYVLITWSDGSQTLFEAESEERWSKSFIIDGENVRTDIVDNGSFGITMYRALEWNAHIETPTPTLGE